MNMPEFRKKKTVFHILSAVLLLAATVALGIASVYLNEDYTLDSVSVEAGEHITLDLFFEREVPEEAKFITDVLHISTYTPGVYSVDYHTGAKKRTAVLTVSDTVYPTATLKENIEVFGTKMPSPDTFIATSYDITRLEYSYVNAPEIVGEGEYNVDVAVRDLGGNVLVLPATFTVIFDEEPPVISGVINLDTYVGLELDLFYGVTVTDNIDKEPVLSVNMGSVELTTPGRYDVVYTARDKAGNKSEAHCTVTVIADRIRPEINGVENITTAAGLNVDYLAGITVSDNCDPAVALEVSGEVDFTTPGRYAITYTATDFSGNKTVKRATITVVADKKAPNVICASAVKIPVGHSFDIKKTVKVEDDWDENPVIEYSGSVNTSKAGEYPVTITATDFTGNSSEKNCSVTVGVDTTPPVIMPQEITVIVGGTVSYKKKVTVSDDYYGTPKLTIDSSGVDLGTIGEYTVYYTATDSSGNVSEASAKVNVIAQPTKEELVYQMANKVLSGIIKNGMNDLEKLMAVYVWSNRNIGYIGTSDKSGIIEGAYEGFTARKGDCYTYYCVSRIMLDILGFENTEIKRDPSTNSRHWWNLVKYNDQWYHFDSSRFRYGNGLIFMHTDAEVAEWDRINYGVGHKFIDENLPVRATDSVQYRVDYNRRKIIN